MAASNKSRVGVRDAFGSVLSTAILILVAILAFSVRLFSVIKYESVIHEFDPYFNYRVTKGKIAWRFSIQQLIQYFIRHYYMKLT